MTENALHWRREDIEPNLDYELDLFKNHVTRGVVITDEARKIFMDYALAETTPWDGNFRELRNMVARMGTLAQDGEIRPADVEREIRRMAPTVSAEAPTAPTEPVSAQAGLEAEDPYLKSLLGSGYSERMDAIEIATLKYVLDVCRTSASAAEAGRRLYNVSRDNRATANDSDRIAKFLKTYKLKFSQLQHA